MAHFRHAECFAPEFYFFTCVFILTRNKTEQINKLYRYQNLKQYHSNTNFKILNNIKAIPL